jgi:diaminohydroxyphosphoribosylaminopyrimidine deaminase/5-amino-6-(5-phosphoribosylamino)uracil reductase
MASSGEAGTGSASGHVTFQGRDNEIRLSGTNVSDRVPGRQFDRAADARFMALALALGRRGLGATWPNPAVGAVVVRDGGAGPVIVGRGWTQAGGRPHAETEALRRAGDAARGGTLHVTLEPCSHHGQTAACVDAIIGAGIARVVSAMEDPNPLVAGRGHDRLRAAGVAVEVGVGADDARRAHAGHIRRVRDGRPHVLLKLAVSADGKAGLAGRRPVAITGEAARELVHRMRAMHDAILIGIGTALADDPELTCRLPGMTVRSPVRVVLDTRLRLPLTSRLIRTSQQTPLWVVAGHAASETAERDLRREGAEILRVTAAGSLDLGETLAALAQRGITRLMVEGGPRVAASFVRGDLIDEAVLFHSDRSIGADGIDALDGLPLTALTQSKALAARGLETIGPDRVETFSRPSLPGHTIGT